MDLDNLDEENLYDLYIIEYSDIILNINDEIDEYCNNVYINFYNKKNIKLLNNLIYDNIDYKESSEILKNNEKNNIKELEMNINEMDEYLIDN